MEQDLRVCKKCLKKKIRIRSGRYPNQKDSKFVDENGRQWSGSTCPDCHAEEVKKKKAEKRKEENAD